MDDIEQMRETVAQADAEAMAQQAAEVEAREAPYREFKESAELAAVMAQLEALRLTYIGVDEVKFRKVDSAHMILKNL